MMQEVYVFLCALGSGLIIGFIYDLFRLKRKAVKTKALMLTLDDVAFWVVAAILVFTTTHISNQGELRMYIFVALLLGVVIYFSLLSRWVIRILVFLVKIIIWPFLFMIKILKPPFIWFCEIAGKKTQVAKKKLSHTKTRVNRRFKSMRNIMRKV